MGRFFKLQITTVAVYSELLYSFQMTSKVLSKLALPDVPGVYIFRDQQKRPLYIGRATSLKDRTKSYFSTDLIETRGPRIIDMVTKAKSLTWEVTDSVLEAIILESALIKKYQPHYNVDERDDKSSNYVVITDEPWPRVFLIRSRDFDAHKIGTEKTGYTFENGKTFFKVKAIFGPFVHGGLIKEALKILRKMFPFKDAKSFDARYNLFYQALGRSPKGTDDNSRRRYQRTISNLILFFEGKKKLLQARLEMNMNTYAKNMEFEEAQKMRRLLYALNHVNDMALIKKELVVRSSAMTAGMQGLGQSQSDLPISRSKLHFRMEAYDIAHLSGTNVVGAYTVSINEELAPTEYRKFIISRQENNDVAGLIEIISRRLNHTEWTYPDLIIVDGGEGQLRAANAVLKARRINIPIVAVTKDESHKAGEIIGNKEFAEKYRESIIMLNAEAHRFAINFHKKKRKASFIK